MRIAIATLVLCLIAVSVTCAQVSVERHGEENPVITIAKATFWGGVTGVVLGLAVALVAQENEENIVRWFFVGGVFGGFGYGIYHVATREKPSTALLQLDGEGLDWNVPSVAFERSLGEGPRESHASLTLLRVSF